MFGSIRGRAKTWRTAGAGTFTAVLVAGLLGAFGAFPKPPTPEFTAGGPIETGQWRVVPLKTYVGGREVYPLLKDGQQALVLEAEMTNRTRESSGDYFTLFQPDIALGDDARRPSVILLQDRRMLSGLNPGMTERVAFVWTLQSGASLPTRLRFTVNTKTYKPVDNLKGMPGWFYERPLGDVTLPIEAGASS